MSNSRRRRWPIACAVVAAAIGAGLVLLWPSVRPPLVEVNGSPVEARVLGSGQPTVIFELGAAGGHLAYWKVQSAISRHALTMAYERAGLGRSGQRPEPRSANQGATELHALLDRLQLPPPYVLVGHSYGGLLVRAFAHRYPAEIAGLVLVDPAMEGYYEYMMNETPREWAAAEHAMGEGFRQQWIDMSLALEDARQAWPLPGVPVTIVTADQPLGEWPLKSGKDVERLHQQQLDLAARIPGSRVVTLSDANHMTILGKDQLAREIEEVVEKARTPFRAASSSRK